jgi:hypothetical protein
MDSKNGKIWKKAMAEEMEKIDKNEAWDLVIFPTRIISLVENGCLKII